VLVGCCVGGEGGGGGGGGGGNLILGRVVGCGGGGGTSVVEDSLLKQTCSVSGILPGSRARRAIRMCVSEFPISGNEKN